MGLKVNDNMKDSSDTSSARRRLIRGSFAVPAVLTLYSGGALASKSSKCLAKATTSPSTKDVVNVPGSSFPDTWSRVQLLFSGSTFIFTKASLGSLTLSSAFLSSSFVWQKFGVDPADSIKYNKLYGNPHTNSPSGYSPSTRWAALRFNNLGEVVGIGLSGSGSCVGSSCWTSLKT